MAAPTRLRVLVDDLPPPKSRIDAQAFQLQVLWFGEEFTVTRTLAQFQELRSQLETCFPKAGIPPLTTARRSISWSDASEERYNSNRHAVKKFISDILGTSRRQKAVLLADVSESDAFAMFFLPTDLVEELQAVPRAEMFLLQASQVQQQKVSRGEQHKKTVSVKAGQVVVWEYHVERFNIGFSVHFGGKEVATYRIVQSQTPSHPTYGRYVASKSGKVSLLWDNSYSVSKVVSFRVEVVGQEVMAAASMAETEGRAALLRRRASEAEKASLHEPDEAKSSSSNPDGGEAHAQGDGGAELSPSGNESGRDDGSGGYGVDDSHVATGGDSLDGEEEVSVNTTPNPARVHELEAEVAALQLRSLEETAARKEAEHTATVASTRAEELAARCSELETSLEKANAAAAAANAAPPPTVDTSVLDEFQAENTRLQAAFDEAKVEMKALKAQIRDVEEESSGRVSPDRFGSLEAEHAALQAAMAEATVEMKALKAQICGVEEECSGRVSPDRFENLKVEHTALQAAVAEAMAREEELKTEASLVPDLQAENAGLRMALEEAATREQVLNDTVSGRASPTLVADLQSENAGLRVALEEAAERETATQKAAAERVDAVVVHQLEADVAALRVALEETAEREAVAKESAAQQQVACEKLQEEMDVAATKLDDVAKEHAELLAALPEIREGAWEAGAATMSVWSYVYLRGIHATRLQALKDAAAQAETRAVTLHDENEAWKFAKRDLEARLQELEEQHNADARRVEEVVTVEQSAEQQLEAMTAARDAERARVETLVAELKRVKGSVKAKTGDLKAAFVEAKMEVTSLRATLAQAKAALNKQGDIVKKLKGEKKLLVRELRRRNRCASDDASAPVRSDAPAPTPDSATSSGGPGLNAHTPASGTPASAQAGSTTATTTSAAATASTETSTRGSPATQRASATVQSSSHPRRSWDVSPSANARGGGGVGGGGNATKSVDRPSPHARATTSSTAAPPTATSRTGDAKQARRQAAASSTQQGGAPHSRSPFASHRFFCISSADAPPILHGPRRVAQPKYASISSRQLMYTSQPVDRRFSASPQKPPSQYGIVARGAGDDGGHKKSGFGSWLAGKVKELTTTEVVTSCDNCRAPAIRGVRWRCTVCPSFDMCDACYRSGAHGFEPPSDAAPASVSRQRPHQHQLQRHSMPPHGVGAGSTRPPPTGLSFSDSGVGSGGGTLGAGVAHGELHFAVPGQAQHRVSVVPPGASPARSVPGDPSMPSPARAAEMGLDASLFGPAVAQEAPTSPRASGADVFGAAHLHVRAAAPRDSSSSVDPFSPSHTASGGPVSSGVGDPFFPSPTAAAPSASLPHHGGHAGALQFGMMSSEDHGAHMTWGGGAGGHGSDSGGHHDADTTSGVGGGQSAAALGAGQATGASGFGFMSSPPHTQFGAGTPSYSPASPHHDPFAGMDMLSPSQ